MMTDADPLPLPPPELDPRATWTEPHRRTGEQRVIGVRRQAPHVGRRSPWSGVNVLALASLVVALWAPGAAGAVPTQVASQLAEMSLEQLREVVVSTVSRSQERLDRVAASVYVISADDIRRSGATTLPEVLRLAPTLTVARSDGSQYVVTARGFANVLANKMLVLIDGRTVYTPLFSGVFWEAQDVVLEDIERVEVITGPSTALWGSNAVNGLVHVITRSGLAAQGLAASVQVGSAERVAALRYGGRFDAAAWRVYLKTYDRSTTRTASGTALEDAARGVQGGWRADWNAGGDAFTLQGDLYQARIDQIPHDRERRIAGANVVARWQRDESADTGTQVQVVLDHSERDVPQSYSDLLDTVDVVAQRHFPIGPRHRLTLGGGLRHSRDRFTGNANQAMVPGDRGLTWRRLFAQDQWQLAPDWALTLAASMEDNPYTDVEVLPSARFAWTGLPGGVLWGSASRAVRAPSRVDREYVIPASPPHTFRGGPGFRSEVSDVVELGWRGQPGPALSYAVTVHGARHRRLRSVAPTPTGLVFVNDIGGRSVGIEAWMRWQATRRWRLDTGLTLLDQDLRPEPGTVDAGGLAALGNSARRQALLRSSVDLGRGWRWDVDLRHMGSLPSPSVPAYTAVDTRVAWVATPAVEVALGVHNVFDPRHPEWGAAASRVEIERAVFVRLRVNH